MLPAIENLIQNLHKELQTGHARWQKLPQYLEKQENEGLLLFLMGQDPYAREKLLHRSGDIAKEFYCFSDEMYTYSLFLDAEGKWNFGLQTRVEQTPAFFAADKPEEQALLKKVAALIKGKENRLPQELQYLAEETAEETQEQETEEQEGIAWI